jgi:hypothetical protein
MSNTSMSKEMGDDTEWVVQYHKSSLYIWEGMIGDLSIRCEGGQQCRGICWRGIKLRYNYDCVCTKLWYQVIGNLGISW